MSSGCGTPDWRSIPTGCVAGCEGCRKEALSEKIFVSEEVQAQFIASEGLQAWLIIWEEIQASSIVVCSGV
jgi:hypothetical protein